MKNFFGWLLSVAFLFVIFISILAYPAVKNYLTGTDMIVEYSWVRPNTVEIQAAYNSAIPTGYSLYVYSVEPTNRIDNGFTVSNEGWDYVTYTNGWRGKAYLEINHTEVIQAVCVRTGTNPKTAFTNNTFSFDTADILNFAIQIDCR